MFCHSMTTNRLGRNVADYVGLFTERRCANMLQVNRECWASRGSEKDCFHKQMSIPYN